MRRECEVIDGHGAGVLAPAAIDDLPRRPGRDAMSPWPEEPGVIQRPETPADGEQHVLEHVIGIGRLTHHGSQSRRQKLLRDQDEPFDMLATSCLGVEHQPRFGLSGRVHGPNAAWIPGAVRPRPRR